MIDGNAQSQSLLAFDMGTATGYPAKRTALQRSSNGREAKFQLTLVRPRMGSTATPAAAPARVQPDPSSTEPRTWCDLSVIRGNTVQARPWEHNHLVREIRSPAVRKHRIGAPCHGHHDPGRDDQPPAEDSGMAAHGPGQSRPRVRGDQRGDRSRAGSVPACDTGHAGQSAELG